MEYEKKQGVSQLELLCTEFENEERSKEHKKEMKRKKKKKSKQGKKLTFAAKPTLSQQSLVRHGHQFPGSACCSAHSSVLLSYGVLRTVVYSLFKCSI